MNCSHTFSTLKRLIFIFVATTSISHAGIITITDPLAVTASSHYLNGPDDYHPKNVIDGILPANYLDRSYWNAGQDTGSLQVNLGDIYKIDLVELYLTTGNHFNISVGDGSTWSLINNTLQQTAPYAAPGSANHHYDWYTVTPDSILSGQYLRYEVVSGGGHWAHLGEIKIYGTLDLGSPIPEPSILVLMCAGLLGLGLTRRRKIV